LLKDPINCKSAAKRATAACAAIQYTQLFVIQLKTINTITFVCGNFNKQAVYLGLNMLAAFEPHHHHDSYVSNLLQTFFSIAFSLCCDLYLCSAQHCTYKRQLTVVLMQSLWLSADALSISVADVLQTCKTQ
jgi:hypothetical protein